MRVFITDGDERPALAITRSLGRRGIDVLVGEARPRSLASSSKYCTGHVTYPSPYEHREAFEQFLVDLVVRERIDVVMPVSDVTTHAVARRQADLERHSSTAIPPLDAFELLSDKGRLLERAAACDIPTPRSHHVSSATALPAVLPEIKYPAVIKPARSRIPTSSGWLAASVHYAHSERDLLRLYRETPYLTHHPSLIQERIPGSGIGLFVLCDRGRIVTAFAHRRVREKPPSGGASVLCESVALDPVLRAHAERLLPPLGWHGVAMLEYKRDRRTGLPFLIEVNGRFWGSLQLAVEAGVDFPYLAWQLALGHQVEPPRSYAIGIRSRWLLGDLDHLLTRFIHDGIDAADLPSRGRALAEFLTLRSPAARNEIWRRDDVGPALHELGRYAGGVIGSMTKQARRFVRGTTSGRITPVPPVPPSRENLDAAR